VGNWIASFVFGIASPILALYVAGPLIVHAVRTGELIARGRSYFRDAQPKRYWFGLVFWFAMIALSFAGSYAVFRPYLVH
jgi:hypothetical protein